MEPSQPLAANPEIAESLSPIEFDVESECFQATYDSTRDATSLAVVAVVATARGEDPLALTPLQTVIDTEAFDNLTTESATGLGNCDSISFRYDGFEITVTSEGVIEAAPIENA
ncbi:HalOD1 output domain-containing protein [Natronobeatus ordinarius]|uniref:HalOD1 output domain-containing protein n=1 Tax=Natronobeatus ordinarius TaxID=2963433 RepID=UPI0020CCAA25|nr:HalOD1 output domain-containing protein [Natronobeatus ordinarius]